MIQRIQTLFLILAIGLAVAFFFVPFGYAPVMDIDTHVGVLQPLKAGSFLGLTVPVILSIVFMLAAIFAFKKYGAQKKLTLLAALSTLVAIGIVVYAVTTSYHGTEPEVTIASTWGIGGLMLAASLMAELAAYRYIRKDERLIRSLDRIR